MDISDTPSELGKTIRYSKGRTCSRCIMDETDPDISFDENGVCNHCRRFDQIAATVWFPDERGAVKLQEISKQIREQGRGKEYDCVIGISGGVDSSYLMHVAVNIMGLRPLAVHVDAGWNSELAVANIKRLVDKLGIDLFTYVVDWGEMRELQKAFLRAGVANQDIPQDHAFAAKTLEVTATKGIRYILNGSNYATETILPTAWGYDAMDSRHLKAIFAKHGHGKLKTFPTVPLWKILFYYPYIKKMKVVNPLNLLPYNKQEAMEFLTEEYGWVYYGGKHYESRWTKFFQGYFLPARFGYDKRRAHLASLVTSGQMTREAALEEMTTELALDAAKDELNYVIKKLDMDPAEFDACFNMPLVPYSDYPNNEKLLNWLQSTVRRVRSWQKSISQPVDTTATPVGESQKS